VRPRDIRLGATAGADVATAVESISTIGHESHVQLRGENSFVTVVVREAPAVGERVGLWFDRGAMHLFDITSGERLT
jgi:ABC-type sugar transport system ATPase subunit